MSCFSSLFLTKVTIPINVTSVIRESVLNCRLMARKFLLFHYVETKVTVGKRFKSFFQLSMIVNAIFKLCEHKNLFLSKITLRIMFLRGFLRLLINCLNSKRSNFSFSTACFFNCLYLLYLDLLYRYVQVVKIFLFTLKIRRIC